MSWLKKHKQKSDKKKKTPTRVLTEAESEAKQYGYIQEAYADRYSKRALQAAFELGDTTYIDENGREYVH